MARNRQCHSAFSIVFAAGTSVVLATAKQRYPRNQIAFKILWLSISSIENTLHIK
jgi:hypothetical protein